MVVYKVPLSSCLVVVVDRSEVRAYEFYEHGSVLHTLELVTQLWVAFHVVATLRLACVPILQHWRWE